MAAGGRTFADLADAVFVAAQFEAERIVVLRDLVNREGARGLAARTLAEAEARGGHLVAAFNLLYDLVPFEDDALAALDALRSGAARSARSAA